jgi:hypothetical protein
MSAVLRVVVHDSFLPEKKYILRSLFEDFLGLPLHIQWDDEETYRVVLPSGHRLVVADAFWAQSPTQQYLTRENVPNATRLFRSPLSEEDDVVTLFGDGQWGSTPLARTLQRGSISDQEECHGKAKEVQ